MTEPRLRTLVVDDEPNIRSTLSVCLESVGCEVPTLGGDFSLEQIEQEHLLRVLARAPTREAAARVLGIDPSTLWRRLKRYEDGEGSSLA